MNRIYSSGDVVVDLEAVTCVSFNAVVVGGVQIKVSDAVAYDLRRQFRAYKESSDKKSESFRVAVASHLRLLAWAADLIGNKLLRRDAAKNLIVNQSQEALANGSTN